MLLLFILCEHCNEISLLAPQTGITALAIASYNGHTSIVQLLLNAGAKMDVQDNVRLQQHLLHHGSLNVGKQGDKP